MKLPHPTAPAPSGALSEGSAAWACPRLEAVLTDLNIIMGDDDDAPSLERTVSALAEVIRRMRLAEAHSTAPATPRLTLTHTETLAAGEALAVALERHRDRAFDGDAAALAAWAKLTGAGK